MDFDADRGVGQLIEHENGGLVLWADYFALVTKYAEAERLLKSADIGNPDWWDHATAFLRAAESRTVGSE
jgi:hypothetical protein